MALSESQRKRIKEQLKNRRKPKPFKEPPQNRLIEMEYAKAIIKEVSQIDDLVNQIIIPELDRLTSHKQERFDVSFKGLAGIALATALIAKVKSAYFGEPISPDSEPTQRIFTRSIKRMITPFLERVKRKTDDTFSKEYQRQTGVEPTPNILNNDDFIDDAVQANVSLIKTIPQRYFSDLEREVKEAVRKGSLSRDLKNKIKELSGNAENSARLIARDQIGKLEANLEEARQRKAGVKEYIWRTRQDSRVRSFANTKGYSDHARLEGTVHHWDNPPVTVFKGPRAGEKHPPSNDIQCRCWAQAIYDEITGVDHPDTIEARKENAA